MVFKFTELSMIYSILLSIGIIFFSFFYLNTKKYIKIKITKKIFKIRLFCMLFFLLFFVFFIRFLNIFRFKSELDLTKLVSLIIKINLVVIIFAILFLLLLRNFFFFFFKKNFLIMHYYILSEKFSYSFRKKYTTFIYFLPSFFYFIKTLQKFKKIIYYFFRYVFIFIFSFLYEIMINNFVLNFTIKLLPYFGLYQFLYTCIFFLFLNMNKGRDLMISKVIYTYTWGCSFDYIDNIYQYLLKLFK